MSDTATVQKDAGHNKHAVKGVAQKGAIRRENEARIIEAAEHVFSEEGFRGASVGTIAERAGVPKPNVYYYFGSKDDLYRSVIQGICDQWMESANVFEKEADPATTLRSYVQDKMDLARTEPRASRLFAMEMARGAPFLQTYIKESVTPWIKEACEVVAHWAEQGLVKADNPQALFYMIWATTQHYADFEAQMIAINDGKRFSDGEFAASTEAVIALVLRSVGLAT